MTPWHWLALLGLLLTLLPWGIYPGVIRLLAPRRTRERPGADAGTGELLTVVLATREPPAMVRARLEDLVRGTWPADQLELIVAVDGDPAPYQFGPLTPAPQRLTIVSRGAEPGKATALNAGVAAATGDLLVFTDTAQRFAPDALATLAGAMRDGRFAAISGALEIGNETATGGSPIAVYWRLERDLRQAEARLHSAIGVTGAIYAMRRALWTPLPQALILDDLWIPMQLVLSGHRVGFEPAAVARDVRTTTPSQEYRRKVRTLTGNLQLLAWLPAVLLPWRNPVWLQFLCHKVLRLVTPFALLASMMGVTGMAFARSPAFGWWLLGGGAAGALGLGLLPGAPGRRARSVLGWGLAMQGALLAAAWNGMRGRWDVWQS